MVFVKLLTQGSRGASRCLAPVVLLALVAALLISAAGTADAMGLPQCDGRTVTIDMTINGGSGFGTSGPDVIFGTPGDDTINGLGGDDVICGRGGADTIFAGAGNDRVFGDDGDDTIFGATGRDFVSGGDGDDLIVGQGGLDTMYGGDGKDIIRGMGANDFIYGGHGADKLFGNGGVDKIWGGAGLDQIWGGNLGDFLYGEGTRDIIRGGGGPDLIEGGTGNDDLFGDANTDSLFGGPGVDLCDGGNGIDTSSDCETEDSIESSVAPPPSISIDPAIEPVGVVLEDLGGAPRPLAAISDPDGSVATFVENELVVTTDNQSELNAILAKTGGEVIAELNPGQEGVNAPNMYLLRVDTAEGDVANLPALLAAAQRPGTGEATGAHDLSSNAAAGLMALAAGEASAGNTVGINWIADPDDIPDESIEGGNAGATDYTRDAYNWSFHTSGSNQDIGVTDAWDALAAAGLYGNRVQYAILDKGFATNNDYPASTSFVNALLPIDADGLRGRSSSPWHGNHVMQTAMAEPDNYFGITGVAHTVAEPINIFTGYDFFTSIGSVLVARGRGAEVINMSYSATVPAAVSFSVLPFEATTLAVRSSGALLFASAGNDGADVDAERCIPLTGICWERTWHTPCENAGVICVGGIGWDSRNRAGNSNFGSLGSGDTVDIYAPFTVYRGVDPDNLSPSVSQRINGTSFSSPFAGAVASLIWAANPSQTANQVEARLFAFAQPSTDPTVNLIVNARDAVRNVIGTAASAEVLTPGDGTSRALGLSLGFTGRAGFLAQAPTSVSVSWTSDRDGLLASTTESAAVGANFYDSSTNEVLSQGTHTITMRVSGGGQTAVDTVTVNITNTRPTATIDQPSTGAAVCPGTTINLRGSAIDLEQGTSIPGSSFSWSSTIDGTIGTGTSRSTNALSVGTHTITLRVVDSGGLADTDSITLTVRSATHATCVDLPPQLTIVTPTNGYTFYTDSSDASGWYSAIEFSVDIDDDNTAVADLSYSWASSLNGSVTPITESITPEWTFINPSTGHIITIPARYQATIKVYADCSLRDETFTLSVQDDAANIGQDAVLLHPSVLC